jgi:hypothetical protein
MTNNGLERMYNALRDKFNIIAESLGNNLFELNESNQGMNLRNLNELYDKLDNSFKVELKELQKDLESRCTEKTYWKQRDRVNER